MEIMKKIAAPFNNGTVTIAFLGDSVTHGCFESDVEMHKACDFEAAYHNRFRQMLNFLYPMRQISIINAGIGGGNATEALARIDRDVISKSPDLTVVCFGLNDVEGSYEDYINSLGGIFTRLHESGSEVVFMTPNMLNTYVADDTASEGLRDYAKKTAEMQNNGRMDRYMNGAKECAAAHNVPVADCYAIWKRMAENGVDTTQLLSNRINHPLREMHILFAQEILNTIMK